MLRIFASEENDNADLCLKMCCVEYLRNFFNDANFRVNTYAHLVPQVVQMASMMLTKCTGNSEAINEILDLFRFMVDKFACMTLAMPGSNGQTVNDFLIQVLQQAWVRFVEVIKGADGDVDEAYGEESIVLHSVVRILSQIIVVSKTIKSTVSSLSYQFKSVSY